MHKQVQAELPPTLSTADKILFARGHISILAREGRKAERTWRCEKEQNFDKFIESMTIFFGEPIKINRNAS